MLCYIQLQPIQYRITEVTLARFHKRDLNPIQGKIRKLRSWSNLAVVIAILRLYEIKIITINKQVVGS